MNQNSDNDRSIAIVCKYGSVPNEGVLTKVFYLSKYLVRKDVDVTLIISDSHHLNSGAVAASEREIEGVRVKTVLTPSYQNSKGMGRIWSWLVFELKAFWVLLNLPKQEYYLASSPSLLTGLTVKLISALKRSKYIFDVRDIWPLTFTEDERISKTSLPYRIFEWIEKVVTRDAAWVMSSLPRLDLYNRKELGLEKPFVFFPICVDEDIVRKQDGPHFKEKQDDRCLVVGYCGSIGVTNNLEPLIEAIELLKNDPRFFFKIVGKGAYKETYQTRLAHCTNVKFYDAVGRDEIWRFNHAIDIGYVSTHDSALWQYGQSLNKLVEYMDGGVPVVISYPDSGYRTMLNEAESGSFVSANDPDELIQELISYSDMSEEERNQMGELGKQWIEKNRRYEGHVDRFYRTVFNASA